MKMSNKNLRRTMLAGLALSVAVLSGCAGMGKAASGPMAVSLNGAQEVPPVTTPASGRASITVSADKSVSGTVTTSGITATAAHIHIGAAGKNGPVVVPMAKNGDNGWAIAPGAKLTDEQYAAYRAGNLYVNVHSAANPGGEIRGQLKGM